MPHLKLLASLGLLAVATTVAAAKEIQDCVLAGPAFPSPSNFADSELLASAISDFEVLLANQELGLRANDTAWGVALFSSKENKTLYEHYYTPPMDVGVQQVDRDSVFRIASISKVFSVWSFLVEAGDGYFNEPITKYVPELADPPYTGDNGTQHNNTLYDDINRVRWEDVTLGELASQAAGIPRGATDMEWPKDADPAQIAGLGLPPINHTERPDCGMNGFLRPCSREEMFTYLLRQHPIFPTAHSPAYSNIAYTLLCYAQEAITGKSCDTTVTESICGALAMKHSSFDEPPSSGGVIPGNNASAAGWDLNLGPSAPSGSMFSSTADIVKAGQAMLQSTLMAPAQTRRWFKPVIQTGYLGSAVGAPWEIRYLEYPNQRVVETFNKGGDLGGYHAQLALSPEHDLGWVVLAGGQASAPGIRNQLANVFSDVFISAAEEQAKEEAATSFDGEYVDKATNSSVTIVSGKDGRAGLVVTEIISRGVELLGPQGPLTQQFGAAESGRLYPTNLRTVSQRSDGTGSYESRLGFRATFFSKTEEGKIGDPCIRAWTALGAPAYGLRTLDDWVFELGENGKAEVLNLRMPRLRLERQESAAR